MLAYGRADRIRLASFRERPAAFAPAIHQTSGCRTKAGRVTESMASGVIGGDPEQTIGTGLLDFCPMRRGCAVRLCQLSLDLRAEPLIGQADDDLVRPVFSAKAASQRVMASAWSAGPSTRSTWSSTSGSSASVHRLGIRQPCWSNRSARFAERTPGQ